jgi:hypothetical protein
MAVRTLPEIMEALAGTISVTTGIRCRQRPPRSVNPPESFPGSRQGKAETCDGEEIAGSRSVTIPVWTVVSATDESQHQTIDQVIAGPQSIAAAVSAAPDLGLGEGVDAAVDGEWAEGEIDVAGTTYWGVRIDVEVFY